MNTPDPLQGVNPNTATHPDYAYFSQVPPPPPVLYSSMPLPPMPPPKRGPWRWLLVLLLVTVAAASGGFGAVLYLAAHPQHTQGSQGNQQGLPATPTQDARNMAFSGDFPTFIEAFATLMANKDYARIEKVTDMQNFQSLTLRASGGFGLWSSTKAELTTGKLSFVIHYPPLTADQEGYSCVGYGPQGIAQYNMNITAQDIKYVVGTASGTIVAGTMQAATDGTVFIFEDPVGPGQFWLWRGYVLNNSFDCQ